MNVRIWVTYPRRRSHYGLEAYSPFNHRLAFALAELLVETDSIG